MFRISLQTGNKRKGNKSDVQNSSACDRYAERLYRAGRQILLS